MFTRTRFFTIHSFVKNSGSNKKRRSAIEFLKIDTSSWTTSRGYCRIMPFVNTTQISHRAQIRNFDAVAAKKNLGKFATICI
jgi:hypothetical protein